MLNAIAPKRGRLGPIDAARGASLVCVCLSHYLTVNAAALVRDRLMMRLMDMTLLATPTFIALSGLLAGVLLSQPEPGRSRMRRRYINRGLFLLLIVHLVLLAAHAPRSLGQSRVMWVFITDPIGVALLVAAMIVGTMSPMRRAFLGLGLYVCAWLEVVWWMPETAAGAIIKGVLFGPEGPLRYSFPIVPWVGVFLVATCIGEAASGTAIENMRRDAVGRGAGAIARLGGGAIVAALMLKAAGKLAVRAGLWTADSTLDVLASQYQKLPPGPVYVLFFGGAGLLSLAAFFPIIRYRFAVTLTAWLQLLGRCSLVVFVVQYFVYWLLVPTWLQVPSVGLWPLTFMATLVPLTALAWVWDRYDLNRLLTVGYPWPQIGRFLVPDRPAIVGTVPRS